MNKLRTLFAVVALAVLASPARAAQPWATGGATSVYELGFSTAAAVPLLVAASEGQLQTVTISSAATGTFCSFYDKAATTSITVATQDGTNAAPKIGEAWFTTAATPATYAINKPFRSGLVVICSAFARVFITGFRN